MFRGLRAVVEQHGPFFWSIFGFSLEGGVARSYRRLIEHRTLPAIVVVGDEPLMPRREVRRYPSLVTEADRAYMAADPMISLHVAPGAGHDVPVQAGTFLREILLSHCAATFRKP